MIGLLNDDEFGQARCPLFSEAASDDRIGVCTDHLRSDRVTTPLSRAAAICSGREDIDLTSESGRASQSHVTGEERAVEPLGESNVRGIVRSDVPA